MDIMQPPRLAMLSRTTVLAVLASQHQILYGDSFPTITTGITVIYVFWCVFDAFHADWFLVFEYVCLWWVWWGFRCCARPASKELGLFFVAQSCPFQCACNPWHSENAMKINKEEVSRERESPVPLKSIEYTACRNGWITEKIQLLGRYLDHTCTYRIPTL